MSFAFRVGRLTPQRAEEIAELASAAAPAGPARSARSPARLVGVARWLHGDRPAASRPVVGSAAP